MAMECQTFKKIWWKTWKPKLENVKLLNVEDKTEYKIIQQQLYNEIMQSEHTKKKNFQESIKLENEI